jgi:hypothetical protein
MSVRIQNILPGADVENFSAVGGLSTTIKTCEDARFAFLTWCGWNERKVYRHLGII